MRCINAVVSYSERTFFCQKIDLYIFGTVTDLQVVLNVSSSYGSPISIQFQYSSMFV